MCCWSDIGVFHYSCVKYHCRNLFPANRLNAPDLLNRRYAILLYEMARSHDARMTAKAHFRRISCPMSITLKTILTGATSGNTSQAKPTPKCQRNVWQGELNWQMGSTYSKWKLMKLTFWSLFAAAVAKFQWSISEFCWEMSQIKGHSKKTTKVKKVDT